MIPFDFMNGVWKARGTINFSGLYDLQEVRDITLTNLDLNTLVSDATWLTVANNKSLMDNINAMAQKLYTLDTASMVVQGDIACNTNPNYPVGYKGDVYRVSAAGRVGGASGKYVDIDNLIICTSDNAGGTEATVGASWQMIQTHNAGNYQPETNIDAIDIYAALLTTASAIDIDSTARTGSTTGFIDINLATAAIGTGDTVFRIVDSRNHDDAGADVYNMMLLQYDGNFPGTSASQTYISNIVVNGTIGASGALADVFGQFINFNGYTHTAGDVYGQYIDMNTTVVAGTQTGLYIKASATTTDGIIIDRGTVDATAGNALDIDFHINDAALSAVTLDVINATTAFSTAKIAYGYNTSITNMAASTDGSAIVGNSVTLTSVSTSRTDLSGFAALIDGEMDTADTMAGLTVGFLNTAELDGGTWYGLRIAGNDTVDNYTHTSGTWYGSLITHAGTVTAGAVYGSAISMDVVDTNLNKYGLLISKDLTGELTADVAVSLDACQIRVDSVNTSSTNFDLTTGGNVLVVGLSHTSTTTNAKTDVDGITGRGLVIDVDFVTSGANDKIDIGSTHTAFIIDYTETQTAGLISHDAFELASIQYNTAGNISYDAGNYDLLYILGNNNAGTPVYAATTYISGAKIDLSAMDITDADLTLYGLNIVMPTTYGASTEVAAHFVGDNRRLDLLTDTAHVSSTESIITDMPVPTVGADIGVAGSPAYWVPLGKRGASGMTVTEFYIDLTGLSSVADDGDVIGDTGQTTSATLGQYTTAIMGTIATGGVIEMVCLEAPVGGTADIDLYSHVTGTLSIDDDASGGTQLINAGGAWTNGMVKGATADPTAADYFYLTAGAAAAGDYSAGKFVIRIYGA